MIPLRIADVHAVDIPDAWYQLVRMCLEYGQHYTVEQGSFTGQTRLELDSTQVYIKKAYNINTDGSYDAMLPVMPEGSTIPAPVESGYVEKYMPYIMTGEIAENESYTYGSRINRYKLPRPAAFVPDNFLNQVSHVLGLIAKTPHTNQAILQVAEPADCMLEDPPCLRHIDVKVRVHDDKQYLVFYPYFRSWDLWSGFPANLAGLAVLQNHMAYMVGMEVGPMVAYSKGLHIYGYAEDLAHMRYTL